MDDIVKIPATVFRATDSKHFYYPNLYFKFDDGRGSLGPVFGCTAEGQRVIISIETVPKEEVPVTIPDPAFGLYLPG